MSEKVSGSYISQEDIQNALTYKEKDVDDNNLCDTRFTNSMHSAQILSVSETSIHPLNQEQNETHDTIKKIGDQLNLSTEQTLITSVKTVSAVVTDAPTTVSDTSAIIPELVDNPVVNNGTFNESVVYDQKDITYEGEVAIYTNPSTGDQFQWNKESETWIIRENPGLYGFENDTHTYTDKAGIIFEWDKEKSAWFPKIDDNFMAQYQMSYGCNETTKDESVTAPEPKLEKPLEEPTEQVLPGQKRKPSDPKWFDQDHTQNTKVYVSNLPLDITDDEFLELMQKCGIIMRDLTTNQMKIKLYKEPNSDLLKGDGLCTYIRRESVDLALKLIDGSDLRGKKIKVELAKFQLKGDYNPTLKPKSKKRKEKMKLKQQQEKMFDWRPEKMIGERAKHERIVILKNVFDFKVFDNDVGLILEYQQDLREECSKCGDVRKVVLYDRHPEGVAQINMATAEEADAVVKLLNNRWFSKRKLCVEIWDGKTKYKVQETDSQITERIGNWDKFLEDDKQTGNA